jgi:hypothetical protein
MAKREKIIRVRMLLDHPSQIWTADGARRDLKRDDEIRMTQEHGLRLVANGYATEDLKADVSDLPTTNLDKTPDAVAAQTHPVIVAAKERLRPPKIEPTQEQIDSRNRYLDYLKRRGERLTGWVGA